VHAIILASGLGTRLMNLTRGIPKCFFNVGSIPLMAYPILSLRVAGVNAFTIVVPKGYRYLAEDIASSLSIKVCIVENETPERGNAYSIMIARECISDREFIVSCCDSIYPPKIGEIMIKAGDDYDIIIGGSKFKDFINVAEATKILVIDHEVFSIGKHLVDFNYIDTGVFKMKSRIFDLIETIPKNREYHLFDLLTTALKQGYRIALADLDEIPWTEVDTPEDLRELKHGKRKEILNEILNSAHTIIKV